VAYEIYELKHASKCRIRNGRIWDTYGRTWF
jgi:hypothetical protein